MPGDPVGVLVSDLSELGLPFRVAELFGRTCPLEVELGVGRGRFLLEWAGAHPEIGIVGVERARKYAEIAAVRVARRGLGNVRVIHTTAEDLLFRCLAPGSVAAAHVYFPDPWPKSRHHKRRFFNAANLARLAEVLRPGGVLRVKTDHDAYAVVIADLLAHEARLEPLPVAETFATIPETSFEIKYGQQGRAVHRFACRRREDAS